jgi:hypothetical protein
MIRTDHNIVFVPYFAADEAQTLDPIFRNNESAVEGMSNTVSKHLPQELTSNLLYLQLPLQS